MKLTSDFYVIKLASLIKKKFKYLELGFFQNICLKAFWLFCHFSSGLNILYPGETEINNLLKLVLTEGENYPLIILEQPSLFLSLSTQPDIKIIDISFLCVC